MNGIEGVALTDGGSQLNLVSKEYCDRVGAVMRPSSAEWGSTAGGVTRALGCVTLSVVPPVEVGIVEPISVECHVAASLPFDIILRAPPMDGWERDFWIWRAGESKGWATMKGRRRARKARRNAKTLGNAAVVALLAMTVAVAGGPSWEVFRDGQFEFPGAAAEVAAEVAEPTLEERVADSVAAQPPDLATAPLDVPADTLPEERQALRETLLDFKEAFVPRKTGIIMDPLPLPVIEGKVPVAAPGHPRYVSSEPKRAAMSAQLAKLLEKGIIRRCAPNSNKTYSGQVVMAPKLGRPGEYRFCADFRQYNEIAAADTRNFPSVGDSIASLNGCRRFFSLDLLAGFHQIPLAEADKHKTRFVTADGDFEFNFLPFGVTNGPSMCQTMMDAKFRDLIGRRVTSVYMDDMAGGDRQPVPDDGDVDASWSPPAGVRDDWGNMLRNLRRVLRRAVENGIVFTLSKCRFGFEQHRWLGQVVTSTGRRIDPSRFEGLRNMQEPQNKAQLVSFCALASYFRDFVPHMAELLNAFGDLQKQYARFNWTATHSAAFRAVIDAICNAGELVHLDWSHPFVVQTDASQHAIGAVLLTGPPDNLRPYAYISRRLTPAERKWNTTEKEGLAIHWAVTDKWAEILWGRPFLLNTDHKNLTYMMESDNPRVRRWVSSLGRFTFKASHIEGAKNVIADGISRVGVEPVTASATTRSNKQVRFNMPVERTGGGTAESAGPSAGGGESSAPPAAAPAPPVRSSPQTAGKRLHLPSAIAAAQGSMADKERDSWLARPHRHVIIGDVRLLAADLPNDNWAYIVPEGVDGDAIRAEVLRLAHDDETAAHGGVDRTLRRLHDGHVTWDSIDEDVKEYVHSCVPCQKNKTGQQQRRHGYMRYVGARRPWERLQIDLIGRLPASIDGYLHILVVLDVFTRYLIVRPLRDATALSVLKALRESVWCFGYPDIVQTDGGSSFDNLDIENELRRLGIAYHRTTPYHHESQGAVERVNRTVEEMIRTLIDGNSPRWEDVLPSVAFAYNTAPHTSTGVSPANAVLRFPITTILSFRAKGGQDELDFSDMRSVDEYYEDAEMATLELYESIKEQQRVAAAKRRKQYDKAVVPVTFEPGDDVLVYRERHGKLDPARAGPFKIIRRHPENANLYLVEPPPERGSKSRDADPVVVHVNHLLRADTSRMSPEDRLYSAARPDTNIIESVAAHTGDSPATYRFFIVWRGEGPLRGTWEPLVGRTVDGKPSGVGKSEVVLDYMREHGLTIPVVESRSGTTRRRRKA